MEEQAQAVVTDRETVVRTYADMVYKLVLYKRPVYRGELAGDISVEVSWSRSL